MRVKYLAQERNAVPGPGLEPGPPDGVQRNNHLATAPPTLVYELLAYCCLSGYYLRFLLLVSKGSVNFQVPIG